MIKSFSLLKRREALSHEDFVRHWHDVHVPMSADVPGLRGYIVSTIVEQQTRSDVPGFAMAPFDGLAQVWFDDLEARARAGASVEGKRWHADGAAIIGSIRMFMTNEISVVPVPARRPPLKTLSVIKRKSELSRAQFRHHWCDIHAPMARGVPKLRGFALSELVEDQFRPDIPPFPMDGPIDGFAESWWDSREARAEMVASEQGKAWFADGAKFIGAVQSILLSERVVIAPPA
jgi:uncharacterized protein (TIGR02118 family)